MDDGPTAPRPVLLLTRPDSAGARFAQAFRARFGLDWPVVFSPLIAVVPTDPPARDRALADRAGAVVLTSAQAVGPLVAISAARGRVAWCVGAATARAAQAEGFAVRQAEGGDATSLRALILAEAPQGDALIHARGTHLAGELARSLRENGCECAEITVYDQQARALNAAARAVLKQAGAVLLPVFSPRSGQILRAELAALGGDLRAKTQVVAISSAAARGFAGAGLSLAARPDADAVLDALDMRIAALRRDFLRG